MPFPLPLLLVAPALALTPDDDATLLQMEAMRLPALAFRDFAEHEDAETRRRAARSLGRLRTAAALSPLKGLLGDAEASVRAEAAWALGLTPGGARPLLDHLDNEPSDAVRVQVIRGLGGQGSASAVPALLRALEAPGAFGRQPPTVEAAALALGRMAARGVEGVDTDDVVRALVAQKDRLSTPTRLAAAFALARVRRADPPAAVRADLLTWAQEEPRAAVQAYLVRAVGALERDRDAAKVVRAAFTDPDEGVRINAARAAGSLGLKAVQQLLDDKDPAVRREAMAAVPLSKALDAPALLQPVVDAGSELDAEEAAKAVGDPRLLDAVAALTALATHGHVERPGPYLKPSRPTAIRVAALEAVTAPIKLRSLAAEDGEPAVRTAAAARLLAIDGLEPIHARALLEAFDPMVASLAASWLADHPDRKSEGALLGLLEESDQSDVLVGCLRALEALYGGDWPRVQRPATPLDPFVTPLTGHADRQVRDAALALSDALDLEAPGPWHGLSVDGATPADLEDVRSARITTTRGEITVALLPEVAPLTVHNFVTLAERDWFDNLRLHRVVPDFVVQAGDPRGDGMGGPGWSIPDEPSPLTYSEGTLGMALSGPDTGGSQWFLTLSPQPHLDDVYPIFGRVTRGMGVVHSLTPMDRIIDVEIERVAPFPSEAKAQAAR